MIKIKQFFCLTHRKKRYQMLLRVSVAMSKRGQNCLVSSWRKQVNLKWWKDDSRWRPEQKRALLTASTTKLQVMWVDSVGTSRGSSHLEEVSWLSVVPSISVSVQLLHTYIHFYLKSRFEISNCTADVDLLLLSLD